jgi:hypothetical protein|tara:strand:+ start:3538 stop:4068 length:531 start_codon:yes stop_codon:yes gene_type:complete
MTEEKEIKPTKQEAKDEKEKTLYLARLDSIVRHIQNVQSNALLLAERLIEQDGECELARQLVANSLGHDASKLFGIEWDYLLSDDKDKLKMAIEQHNKTNTHHPEHWGGIKEMPRVYLAEFICDIKARSSEFGTDVKNWLKDEATKRYNFTTGSRVYKDLLYFLNLLLEQKFSKKL